MTDQTTKLLTDRRLAQFGDSLLNFAYSLALTRSTKKPVGVKVRDKTLAKAASQAGLRKFLPKRVDAGHVANSLEALIGHVWLQDRLTLDEIVDSLRARELDDNDESKPFLRLAQFALARLEEHK